MANSEPIVRTESREIALLVADESLSITYASCEAGERIAGPHVHPGHTEAFYVLEGELSFVLGPEGETITIGPGGFVAAPPGYAHGFGTAGSARARWLIVHARDAGFADFMRGLRDGVEVDWDLTPVPDDGGLSIGHAIVSRA
jgi:quercetin dioxygenase-like cupin family protein